MKPPDRGERRSSAGIRLLDLVGAGVGLVLLGPLIGVLAAVVRLTSPGPAFHKAIRAGLDGRPFVLLKLRSMTVDAATVGPGVTAAGDPRITRVGKILRDTKLDELPQFFNVLSGDMSLVGPRPEDFRYVALYSRDQLAILDTKPGMTSPASLEYHDEEHLLEGDDWEQRYVDEVMPAKISLDLAYQRDRTALTDFKLILRTVKKVARGRLS